MTVKNIGNGMVELDCPFSDLKIEMKGKDLEHIKKCAEELRKKLKERGDSYTFTVK